ncbi:hypothetical protein [Porphyrobacter sp. AAP82]|uniref:hypothetical protein n=1 Tax=Porphyrobacter sp. AAP82 TaxID=1248917 RepID=UPI0012DD5D9C|nr:hypothetical protein [Porphyrobacter sp. AAP82]
MIYKKKLSKSDFARGIDCPRKLFYAGNPNYHDASASNSFLKSLAASGFQIGALAKQLFPDGIDLDGLLPQPALAKTGELLRNEEVTIFEPAFTQRRMMRLRFAKRRRR